MRGTLRGIKHGAEVRPTSVWEDWLFNSARWYCWEVRDKDGLVSATGVEPTEEAAEVQLWRAIRGQRVMTDSREWGQMIWMERGEGGEWGWFWEVTDRWGWRCKVGWNRERAAAERELAAGFIEVRGW